MSYLQLAPLVSVIIPAYNAEEYIDVAVQSVLVQTWKNWELIIINDGSTDGTESYLKKLEHPSIHVKNQENRGVSAARNTGLAMAKGSLITFLDVDDMLPPQSLELRVRYLEQHTDVDIVDGRISVCDATLSVEKSSYNPYYFGLFLPRLLRLDANVFFGPFYMFRASVLGDTVFSETMTHAEDILFFTTLASRRKLQYGHVNELVYRYRSTDSSAMSNMEGLEKGYLELLRNIKTLSGITLFDLVFLRLKIARILLLSWRAKGAVGRGVSAAMKAMGTR